MERFKRERSEWVLTKERANSLINTKNKKNKRTKIRYSADSLADMLRSSSAHLSALLLRFDEIDTDGLCSLKSHFESCSKQSGENTNFSMLCKIENTNLSYYHKKFKINYKNVRGLRNRYVFQMDCADGFEHAMKKIPAGIDLSSIYVDGVQYRFLININIMHNYRYEDFLSDCIRSFYVKSGYSKFDIVRSDNFCFKNYNSYVYNMDHQETGNAVARFYGASTTLYKQALLNKKNQKFLSETDKLVFEMTASKHHGLAVLRECCPSLKELLRKPSLEQLLRSLYSCGKIGNSPYSRYATDKKIDEEKVLGLQSVLHRYACNNKKNLNKYIVDYDVAPEDFPVMGHLIRAASVYDSKFPIEIK